MSIKYTCKKSKIILYSTCLLIFCCITAGYAQRPEKKATLLNFLIYEKYTDPEKKIKDAEIRIQGLQFTFYTQHDGQINDINISAFSPLKKYKNENCYYLTISINRKGYYPVENLHRVIPAHRETNIHIPLVKIPVRKAIRYIAGISPYLAKQELGDTLGLEYDVFPLSVTHFDVVFFTKGKYLLSIPLELGYFAFKETYSYAMLSTYAERTTYYYKILMTGTGIKGHIRYQNFLPYVGTSLHYYHELSDTGHVKNFGYSFLGGIGYQFYSYIASLECRYIYIAKDQPDVQFNYMGNASIENKLKPVHLLYFGIMFSYVFEK